MDSDLQRRYHEGDATALAALWDLHKKTLFAQSSRQCGGNQDKAEDALQELYRKLSEERARRQYDPERPWTRWVSGILTKLILTRPGVQRYFCLGTRALQELAADGVASSTLNRLRGVVGKRYYSGVEFANGLMNVLSREEVDMFAALITQVAECGREVKSIDQECGQELRDFSARTPLHEVLLKESGRDINECFELLSDSEKDLIVLRVLYRWSFRRIAEVLDGKPDPNLAAGPYYRAHQRLKKCLEKKRYSEADL